MKNKNKLKKFGSKYAWSYYIESFPYFKDVFQLAELEQAFKGKYPKKLLVKKLFPISIGVYLGLLFLAGFLFPVPYSPTLNTISDLGNPILNPTGWLFFSISFIFLALILIPFCMFVYRRLTPMDKLLPKIGLGANIASSVGLVMLAIFSNVETLLFIHGLAAIIAFGGLIIGGIFYWAIIVKSALIKRTLKKKGGIHLSLVGIGSMGFIIFLIIQLISWANIDILLDFETIIASLDAIFSNFPIWEWLLFIMVGFQTVLLFIIIPDFKQIKEIKRKGINKLLGCRDGKKNIILCYEEFDYNPLDNKTPKKSKRKSQIAS